MAKPNLRHIDPSIRNCAISLISEAIGSINATMQADPTVSFYVARERALISAANRWVGTYGKECADKAVRGLHCLAPDEVIERDTARMTRNYRADETRRMLTEFDPKRDTWLNRACISLTGLRLYSVLLATALAASTLITGGVDEAQARPGASQGREWRALALCGVSKPGPGRESACARSNAADPGTFRSFDGLTGSSRS